MSSSGSDDNTIRDYLLGRLSDEDREEFARRFFTDEELFEKLQAAEDDLIDDFLSGNFSQDDIDMFHRNFLIGSKRQRRLRIGKAWRNYAAAHAGEKPPKPEPVSRRWWQVFSPSASGDGTITVFSPSALRIGTLATLLVITALVVWIISRPSEVDKGLYALNAAYQQERPLESRITELGYAPYTPSSTRGAGPGKVEQNELIQAELTLRGVVNTKPTSEAHHALGKVFLAKKEFDKAIEQFDEALKADPNNAQIYADRGATLLERGKLEIETADTDSAESGKGIEYFARSLENLNKALQLDTNLSEALYNRALLHESMGLLPQAEDDWRKYLENDPNSKWTDEARARLTKIQQRKTTSKAQEEIYQKFLSDLNSSDEEAVWTTVSGYQNRTGNVVVEQLIKDYLEAATQNRKEDADRAIQRLTYVGDLQRHKNGDGFFLTWLSFTRPQMPNS